MSLTIGSGPLAAQAANYRIEGPTDRLFWQLFPRRIRALFAGQVVLDSTEAKLLHQSNHLPQLYVPRTDIRVDLLEKSAYQTHSPFIGDATHESIRAGGRVAENAVWSYLRPIEAVAWLAGHVAVHWNAMDAWFDEDEEVFGEIRDPYHRVDARRTSRHVRVTAAGIDIAQSRRALLVSETGLPNRFYLPMNDVRTEYLAPSATHTICPYKGTASYHALRIQDTFISDAAWSYPAPLVEAPQLAGHLCFLAKGVQTWVEGKPLG